MTAQRRDYRRAVDVQDLNMNIRYAGRAGRIRPLLRPAGVQRGITKAGDVGVAAAGHFAVLVENLPRVVERGRR